MLTAFLSVLFVCLGFLCGVVFCLFCFVLVLDFLFCFVLDFFFADALVEVT